ncbi:MAG: protein kinase [Clostridia bacterium]|nr:protein kinase [Clostridia bacterium]
MIDRIISGRYLIRSQIGSGGMAVVYRATDIKTGDTVALKVLRQEYNSDAEFIGRFVREAEAASKMFHENIVNTLDYGEDGDERYIVMEYVEGQTLKEMIRQMGRIPVRTAVPMAIRILAAVDHAHKNNIVHRDIKPQNILVDKNGEVKVADFGIARRMRHDGGSTNVKDSNLAMGSVHYFSPEQAAGEAADQKSDLYSVGVVLYEMLTGQLPFDGDTALAVALKHVNEDPPSMRSIDSAISRGLDEVVMRALCKDSFKRYQNAADMAADLKKALRSPRGGFVRYPETKEERQARKSRQAQRNRKLRRWIVVGCLAVAVLVCAVIGTRMAMHRRRLIEFSQMPQTVGASLESARALLTEFELQCDVAYVYDDQVAEGTVLGQSEEAGAWVHKNGVVTLTVCAGRSTMDVPALVGLSEDAARQALAECGAQDVKVEYTADEEHSGQVVEQTPEQSTVERGTTVTITVGARPCAVPGVLGMSREAAELAIVAAGLKVGTVTEAYSQDGQPGTVIAQSLQPDSSALEGEAVDLTIVQYEQPQYYVYPLIPVDVPEGGARVMLAMQTPSGNTSEMSVDVPDGGRHELSLTSQESGTHIIDIYVDGVWVEQISREFQ